MSKKAINSRSASQYLNLAKSSFFRFKIIIFVVFVALIYGYVFMQINSFANTKPSPIAIADQQHAGTKIPHIDPATIQKIEKLQDNSVNVQALFNQARQNPFSQ